MPIIIKLVESQVDYRHLDLYDLEDKMGIAHPTLSDNFFLGFLR